MDVKRRNPVAQYSSVKLNVFAPAFGITIALLNITGKKNIY
jgi:hypothetical protein